MVEGRGSRTLEELDGWLAAHPDPTGRQLAEAGYVVPHWPAPWGLGAEPSDQLAIDAALSAAKVKRPHNPIGIGWAGPTLMAAGTEAQQQRWLPGLLSGDEFWCQLFSEPGAGSDLSALSTRAVRDGDEWIVTGQKVWTSYGHLAKWGILLARTDDAEDRHHGITYFICPMDAPGIEVRPLVDMTGNHTFNEVFFDEVRVPADHVVGAVDDGWRLAMVTLANERVSLSGDGLMWGMGPVIGDLVALARRIGVGPVDRARLASLWARSETLRMLKLRLVAAALAGRTPGPEASVRKALADEVGQDAAGLAVDLLGMAAVTGCVAPQDLQWSWCFTFSPSLTIGGGTSVVQRNIIAERVLGLPRDLEG